MAKKFKIAHLAGITREHEEQFRSAEKDGIYRICPRLL